MFPSQVLSEAWILKLFLVLQLFSGGLFLALNESRRRDTSGHVMVYWTITPHRSGRVLEHQQRQGRSPPVPAGESSGPPLPGTALFSPGRQRLSAPHNPLRVGLPEPLCSVFLNWPHGSHLRISAIHSECLTAWPTLQAARRHLLIGQITAGCVPARHNPQVLRRKPEQTDLLPVFAAGEPVSSYYNQPH